MPQENGGQMKEGHERQRRLVASRGYPAKVLHFAEHALYRVALPV